MNLRTAIIIATISISSASYAAPPGISCSPHDVADIKSRAAQGNPRAQYMLGIQLDLGACGAKDHKLADALFHQSATQNYPPAVQILGIIFRRDGNYTEALKYFERSAQLGYKYGFADMGYAYGIHDSPVRNDVLSYAWFTLAISRETNAHMREYLESSRHKIEDTMSEGDLAKANDVTAELSAKFSSIPGWSEKQ